MKLWIRWWYLIRQLRPACKRESTFFWMVTTLIGFIVRPDLLGVTSLIRGLGIDKIYYDRLLDFFHSSSVIIDQLTQLWIRIVFRSFPSVEFNQRKVLLGDGIKIAKSGKKMPGVKKMYQESESNTKPQYIFGHSCQAISLLGGNLKSSFAVPLISRIHEGVKYTNRDKRSVIDKMVELINSLTIPSPYYFVADAYYASQKMIKGMLKLNNHLISRVRTNAVAYFQSNQSNKRGRPRKYGEKIYLRTLFDDLSTMQEIKSPVYGDSGIFIKYRYEDLLWKDAGVVVRFVIVHHPIRGNIILISTDRSLSAEQIIQLYGLRFKIEVSFKQALRTIGAYGYHFWMSNMKRINRKGKTQHLHRSESSYRMEVKRKIDAYHRFIQLGLIAQGSLMYLSCCCTKTVWKYFRSWIRTIRPDVLPSEMIVSTAMKNTVFDFLRVSAKRINCIKFIVDKIDLTRAVVAKLVA